MAPRSTTLNITRHAIFAALAGTRKELTVVLVISGNIGTIRTLLHIIGTEHVSRTFGELATVARILGQDISTGAPFLFVVAKARRNTLPHTHVIRAINFLTIFTVAAVASVGVSSIARITTEWNGGQQRSNVALFGSGSAYEKQSTENGGKEELHVVRDPDL